LFSNTDDNISQTDIVMLLTPRIIRTHEYTVKDLSPLFVGTNQNFGLTGPPPLIAAPPVETPAPAPPGAAAPPQGLPTPTVPQPSGQVTAPVPPLTEPQRDLTAPQTTTLTGPTQVSVTPPQGDVRVGAGPYLVPIYVSNVSRASTMTLTLTYNPAVLRVRAIQEASFMRQGAANVVFTPNSDAATGRIDLAFVRTGDSVGASGSGLLAAVQFDAVGPGTSQLSVSGVVANPTGGPIAVQFVPASVVVR
jgi:hypothetical protein